METLKGLKRTHYCGDLRMDNVGEEVILNGWVQKKRNLGGLVFVDLSFHLCSGKDTSIV